MSFWIEIVCWIIGYAITGLFAFSIYAKSELELVNWLEKLFFLLCGPIVWVMMRLS